jgi:hypothetical protein
MNVRGRIAAQRGIFERPQGGHILCTLVCAQTDEPGSGGLVLVYFLLDSSGFGSGGENPDKEDPQNYRR